MDFLLRGFLSLAIGLTGSVFIVHGILLIRSRGRIGLLKSDMRTIRSELTVWAPTIESLTEAEQFEVERRFMQLLGWSYVGIGLPFTALGVALGVIGFFAPWTSVGRPHNEWRSHARKRVGGVRHECRLRSRNRYWRS